jgi:MoaA/NifB/PqqE/SkfB family radical SAM enzyme
MLAAFQAADREYRRSSRLTRQATERRSPDDVLDAALAGADPNDPAIRAAAEASRPPTTLLVALARADLAAGSLSSAARLLRKALARDANNLHLQSLYQRATGVEEPPDLARRFCSAPFETLETAPGGDVYFCCPAWLPVPIGNINAEGATEVWNSPAAQEIRESVLDGTYRYCSRVHCPKLSAGALPHRSEVTDRRLRRVIDSGVTRLDDGPKRVVLSHDRSCNLSCPSCRTGRILARKAEQARLNRMADTVLLPLLSNARRLRVTSGGDPFGSAHFQYVLRHLDRSSNPDLRLDLQTNGILLTPRLWERLKLEGRVDQLIVSVDAAEPDTYATVRRGGHFGTLLGNLAFMSALRRERRIRRLRLDFVVQAANFREMPAFVDLARSFAADGVKFQMIRSWGTWTPEEFARQDIGDPAHPEYADFLAVLRDGRLARPYSELWGMAAAIDASMRERPADAVP